MRWHIFCLVAFVFVALEAVFPAWLKFHGIYPEIVLMVCLFITLYGEPDKSLLACLFLGMLKDFFSVGRIGTYALIFFVVGFGTSWLRLYIYRERILPQIVVSFAFTFLANLLYVVSLNFSLFHYPLSECWKIIFFISLYTSLVSPIIFFVLNKIKEHLGIAERRKVFC
ncbi:MAG: rod shape-determining protein MreD [Planctomycetota bacterium]